MEKTRAAAATQGMDQKIATAREQEAGLRPRAAGRALLGDVGAVVAHCGRGRRQRLRREIRRAVQPGAKTKTTPPGYDGIGITIQVHGSYAQDMRFINAVERQKMLLLIDAVSFGGMQGDELTVSVHLIHLFEERGMKAAAGSKTKQWIAIVLVLVAIFTVARSLSRRAAEARRSRSR